MKDSTALLIAATTFVATDHIIAGAFMAVVLILKSAWQAWEINK